MKTIYKKYIKSLWLLSLLGVITFGTFFSSCKEEDPVSDETMLFSYGPMPIARGAELRFIGNRLDKVSSIVIPPAIEISSSEFTEQTESSIKLTVPQTAAEGFVQLNSSDGTITSKTKIGYSEPIDIDGSFSPKTIKPGAVLTINGDYLNLVGEVIFTDRVSVDSTSFISQSRKQITLTVPAEAQTGKIAVSNGAEDPIIIYSEDDLTVVTPTITSLSPLAIKAGSDLTISGNDLDLVSAIEFQGGTTIEAADFSSQSATSIVVAAPSNIMDGTITLVVPSGTVTVSSESLTAIVPTNVLVSAVSRFKAGLNTKITGTDIDLVTSVLFAGGSDITDFTIESGVITVAIPDDAVDGVITLNLASGKTVETTAIELVKPIVTKLNPNPVGAGSQLIITGTDLDLVLSLSYGGIAVEVTPDSETSITTMVPVDATTGGIALNLANGTSINTASLTINTPEFCFIPVLPNPEEVEIKAGSVIVVEIANSDVLSDVVIGGESTQYIVEGNVLHMFIPGNVGGITDFKLLSSTGEITYQIDVIPAGFVETIVFTGPISITWSDGGRAMVPISAFENAPVGSIMKFYFSQVDEWGQLQINNGSWSPIPFAELNNDGYIKTDTYGDKSVSEQELVLTQDVLDNIKNNSDGTWGLIIQGQNWIMNKISIIVITPTAETIWEGSENMGNWAGNVQLPKELWGNAAVGKKLILSYTTDPAGAYWQIMLKNWSWGDVKKIDLADGSTSVEIEITQEILDLMNSDGIIFQGANYTLSKVELE